jgi:dihydrofolate reductase
MGILSVDMFSTLDGVIQAPGGLKEDTEGGFKHGGWQGPFFDDESGTWMAKRFPKFDALLLGRKTYDIFAAYWPKQPKNPFSDQLNSVTKYVASRKLKKVDWQNSNLIAGDVAKAVGTIKKQHKEVRVIGSANLVQTLLEARPRGPVQHLGVPHRVGFGQATVRRRHGPGALEARRVEGVLGGRGAVGLRAGREADVRRYG